MKTHAAALPPLTPAQRASRQALIDAANAEMGAAKRAALDAYTRVHKVGHLCRCSDDCHEAHRVMCLALDDANAEYSAAIRMVM